MFEEMSIADEDVAAGPPPHKAAGVIDLDAFNRQECFTAPASVPSVPTLHYKNKLVNVCYASKAIKRPDEGSKVGEPVPETKTSHPLTVNKSLQQLAEKTSLHNEDFIDEYGIKNSLKSNNFLRDCGCASILVVDDSPFNLLILHEIFGKVIPPKLGRDAEAGEPRVLVDDAANGLQALNKVKDTSKRSC